MTSSQLKFELFEDEFGVSSPKVAAAVEALAKQEGAETRGAIFTRPEIVDFILDLAGYTTDQPFHQKRLLEPSFGEGDFLLPAIDRLLTASAGSKLTITKMPWSRKNMEKNDKITDKRRQRMETRKFVHWQDGNMWLGYLEEYPDYMTQGETFDELKENLRDLYKDLSSGVIPSVRKVDVLEVA